VALDHVTDQVVVPHQRVGAGLAVPIGQARAVLDIGEHEGQEPFGHVLSMPRVYSAPTFKPVR
jgi:hypothetical protein